LFQLNTSRAKISSLKTGTYRVKILIYHNGIMVKALFPFDDDFRRVKFFRSFCLLKTLLVQQPIRLH